MSKVNVTYRGAEFHFETEESAARWANALNHSPNRAAQIAPKSTSVHRPPIPPSPVQDAVKKALSVTPQTSRQLIDAMKRNSYRFTAKDEIIAVNGALAAMEKRSEAKRDGHDGAGRQLWVKGVAG